MQVPIPQNNIANQIAMQNNYRPPLPNVKPPSNMSFHSENVKILNWRTTVKIAETYIGVIVICAIIHYILLEMSQFIAKEATNSTVMMISELISYLDIAFLISATIALVIKTLSDIWGVMAYLKILNISEAEKNLKP